MGQAVRYITKYLRKPNNDTDVKYQTTQTSLWVHNRQSFSISADFKKKLQAYRLDHDWHTPKNIED